MAIRRHATFAGGIDLPDEKQATLARQIEPWPGGTPLRVPLAWGELGAATAIVEPGQSVVQGQIIAEAVGAHSLDIFSPAAGRVGEPVSVQVAAGDRLRSCPALLIHTDDAAILPPKSDECFDWRAAGASSIRQRLVNGGLPTYERRVRPLARWLSAAGERKCDTLIANCMENQPYIACEHRMLVELSRQVVSGLEVIAKALGVAKVMLAVDQRRTSAYQGIVEPANSYGITSVSLHDKYPVGADPILVKLITGREMPPGRSVLDVGVAVTNAATCVAVHDWVACEIPPVGRIVTLAGDKTIQPGNYWVPYGVACCDMSAQGGDGTIHGGAMLGMRCTEDTVVTPATDAVLTIQADVPQSPSPCIRCSWCTDHCPARLNVAELNDAFELPDLALARRLTAQACVECGLCTYVCPARLPLSQRVRQLKRVLTGLDQNMPLFSGTPETP